MKGGEHNSDSREKRRYRLCGSFTQRPHRSPFIAEALLAVRRSSLISDRRFRIAITAWGFVCAAASSLSALKQPTIRVVAIMVEGVPETHTKQLIGYVNANTKVMPKSDTSDGGCCRVWRMKMNLGQLMR
ncbi:unnamed protein product [Fraxinus pennsylvanica]|uniref:Uncharacterized protein n=1 Tax=Fraxinus pennsylvanica TaxID=56036 RepID=A0AAD1YJT5_9LAMI|nr:unnamed protein product [Fraxinus pennsylvanica]